MVYYARWQHNFCSSIQEFHNYKHGVYSVLTESWQGVQKELSPAGADPGIYFGGPNQGPQSKVKGEARIEGAKRRSFEGEAQVEGAKSPRIEGEARDKSGEGSGEGLGEPLPKFFLKNPRCRVHI